MQRAPVYAWHNTKPLVTKDSHLLEGRDFVNGTPRPGYVYPHPLVQIGP